MIDAFDQHAMVIFYIPGAYLNYYMLKDKFVMLKLGDYFVDILYKFNPEFRKDIWQ